jgi:hypothetical protein
MNSYDCIRASRTHAEYSCSRLMISCVEKRGFPIVCPAAAAADGEDVAMGDMVSAEVIDCTVMFTGKMVRARRNYAQICGARWSD